MQRLSMRWLEVEVVRRPAFWLIVAIFVLITIPYYGESLEHPSFIANLYADLDLERHAFERILYLGPIIWAGFLFGERGGLIASFAALACMLPRAIFISDYPRDALLETSAVFIVGNLAALSFQWLRKERERRLQLAALNQTASVVSQSLDLRQILDSSVNNVMDVMKVDAVLVFLLDEAAAELTLTAYRGVSPPFVQGVGRLKVGEGFNGMVAKTGEPLYVEDALTDPSLTRMSVREEGLRSQLIVPLKSKGRTLGTLCASVRSYRRFSQDDMELLIAIANQIGVAIENARLYEHEREVAKQLQASEERYRQLFENAYDAIWLHDLDGNIIAANRSFAKLTGYALKELQGIRADDLIADGCRDSVKGTEDRLPRGGGTGHLSEVSLIKKNKFEVPVQFSTSLVFRDGQLVGFQHIARDVTEEKRLKENLRFYLRRTTMAQEEERKRIARELHDETIQALVVLSRQLDDLATGSESLSEKQRYLLENLWQQTQGIMEGLRRLSQDLRPPTLDRLGLLPALEWLASDVAKHSGIAVEVKVHGTERRLPAAAELVLFRIAQEALRNVWRHSGATSAQVMVEFDGGKSRVTVKDNGRGFKLPSSMGDLAKDGKLGLAGMVERAQLIGGSLKVESEPGKGTTITIEAPT